MKISINKTHSITQKCVSFLTFKCMEFHRVPSPIESQGNDTNSTSYTNNSNLSSSIHLEVPLENEATTDVPNLCENECGDVENHWPIRIDERYKRVEISKQSYPKKKPRPLCVTRETYISRSPSEFYRRNGLDRPLNVLQLISWILFVLNVVCTLLLIILTCPIVLAVNVPIFMMSQSS